MDREAVKSVLRRQEIELPSWAFGNSSDVARTLQAAPVFPQNWAFSSSILPMCSRSWV
jgi:hypothetical protein